MVVPGVGQVQSAPGQHSKERKPGFRLSAKKPPDQIRRPEDYRPTSYNTIVRPHLEYSSSVWDPHTRKKIHAIEMVQRRAARYVKRNYRNTSSVGDMLNDLNWQTLEIRRKNQRLTMMYKIHNNESMITIWLELTETISLRRRGGYCLATHTATSTKSQCAPRITTTTRSSPEQQGSGTNCLMLFMPQQ